MILTIKQTHLNSPVPVAHYILPYLTKQPHKRNYLSSINGEVKVHKFMIWQADVK